MPAVKITNKPIGIPGDDTHFLVTQPELPEGYTPTGQETEEELAELKVESVREIEMDDMVELIQDKLDMDVTPTTGSSKPVTSGGVKAALDEMDEDISSLNEDITNIGTPPTIKDSEQATADLDIVDPDGHVLLRLENGHIKTKNFDSFSAPGNVASTDTEADLNIADQNGNVLVRFQDGHIKTKNFNSASLVDKNTYITVKKDGSGDFTTLRAAIESITDADPVTKPYVIQIYPGTYNLTDEYTQAEISEADVQEYHSGFVGWMLTDGISLEGVGTKETIILSCVLPTTTYNATIRGNVSPLNVQGSVDLSNLTVIAENARYCVHDDFYYTKTEQYSRHVKNCKFIGKNLAHKPACTWGGGMSGVGENAVYENCDFGTDYGHHFDASKPVTIIFKNCRGRKIRLAERAGNRYHHVIIQDSDFEMVSLMRPSGVNSQHIMVEANGCEKAYVSCYDGDIVLTGAITKAPLTNLPVGTMVTRGSGSGNPYTATADKGLADGVIVANDDYFSYVQRTGYINTRILGLTNFSVGDYITIDSNNQLAAGGTASNAVGQITFISNDADSTDTGIGFIKLFVGGMN